MSNSRKIGIYSDSTFLLHATGAGHPERAERLRALEPVFAELPQERFELISSCAPCPEELLATAHSGPHIERVRSACTAGPGYLDSDTHVVPVSWDAALRAVGGVTDACRRVRTGDLARAFCAVRPPGHHAEPSRAMGFCLFNNVAIAARYLQEELGVGSVAIVDFDVHHGNGTQEIFWDDPTVLYASSHQFPHYPGTGRREEVGAGMGLGATLNMPLPGGAGDEMMIPWYEGELATRLRSFKPDFLIVSAGFDAHALDTLSSMSVTTEGFGKITAILAGLADELCGGRLVSVLEGGYHLEALAESVALHLAELAPQER
ncbi:MAG: histone deacetylase [bacterium]|nr:histone deacetylase [bacterium]